MGPAVLQSNLLVNEAVLAFQVQVGNILDGRLSVK